MFRVVSNLAQARQNERSDRAGAPLDFDRLCDPLLREEIKTSRPARVAIWGAGRWGRTLAGAYLRAFPRAAPIDLVAERNHTEVRAWLAAQSFRARIKLHAAGQLVLQDPTLTHVIVSKINAEHLTAARAALAAEKQVY